MPTEQEKAELAKKRGQAAAYISDPDQKQKFISAQGEAERKGKNNTASDEAYHRLHKEADDTLATQGQNKSVGGVMGSFKKGTNYVPKTGKYQLHEGEQVVPKEKNPFALITKGDQKPKKEIHKIVSHKSHDGKIIHTHVHHHPEHHPDETYVSNNPEEMQAHMADQEPNMTAAPSPMPDAGAPAASPAMPPQA